MLVVSVKSLTHGVEDFDRWRTTVDRHGSTSRSRRDSGGYSEALERDAAHRGRYTAAEQFDADRDQDRYDHGHALADLDGIRLDEHGWTEDTHDDSYDRLASVVYEEQLRRHGWRMEVPGDPLNLKCVPCALAKNLYILNAVRRPYVTVGVASSVADDVTMRMTS